MMKELIETLIGGEEYRTFKDERNSKMEENNKKVGNIHENPELLEVE